MSGDLVEADFAGESWVEIRPLETLGTFGDTSGEVTFGEVGNGRVRKLKGLRDAGNMEVVAAIDYSDPGQIAVLAAERTPHNYAFRLLLNDAPAEKSNAVTLSIAAPGVVSWTGHGLAVGTPVKFSTTGALPTGLTAGTTYYVAASGLTSDEFSVAATRGGSAITTTGTQSGTHTATTVPMGSERFFAAKVMSAAENLDAADNVMKLNMQLGIDSNVVRVNAIG
ncbi:MAG TPA: hypothetical protein VGE05_15450, partial [Novosphingobium sp.]